MIPITISKNLFDEWEAVYIDPITEFPVIDRKVPKEEVFHEAFRDFIARRIMIEVAGELRKEQLKYIRDLQTYTEVKAHTLKAIREVNRALSFNMPNIVKKSTIGEMSAYVYEHIFPYLAQFKPKTKKYERLLNYIDYQSLSYSADHQLMIENPEIVTH